MRKAELSEAQRVERDRFVRYLEEFGWDPGGWETLFEGGADLVPEAQAEYVNSTSTLRLGLNLGKSRIRFEWAGQDENDVLSLILHPAYTVKEVLDLIVTIQDTLSFSNGAPLIEALIAVCREAYLETGEELIPLA